MDQDIKKVLEGLPDEIQGVATNWVNRYNPTYNQFIKALNSKHFTGVAMKKQDKRTHKRVGKLKTKQGMSKE